MQLNTESHIKLNTGNVEHLDCGKIIQYELQTEFFKQEETAEMNGMM